MRWLLKNQSRRFFLLKAKNRSPFCNQQGRHIGGCRCACISGSLYPWVTSIKKSLAPPPGYSTFTSALSFCINQHNNRLFRRASFSLWGAGVSYCWIWGKSPDSYRCRSPPPFDSLVNHPWIKWRYIMKKINLRELYPDVYTTDFFVDVTEENLLNI